MRVVLKLLAAQWRFHRTRTVLVLLSFMSALSLIVVMTAAYDSLVAQSSEYARRMFGAYDLLVRQENERRNNGLPGALVTDIMNDSRSEDLEAAALTEFELVDVRPPQEKGENNTVPGEKKKNGERAHEAYIKSRMRVTMKLLSFGSEKNPYPVIKGKWLGQDKDNEVFAVCGRRFAKKMNIRPGGLMTIRTDAGEFTLNIAGYTDHIGMNPELLGFLVSPKTWNRISGAPVLASRLYIKLKPGSDIEEFKDEYTDYSIRAGYDVEVQTLADIAARTGASRTTAMFKYLGSGASTLAAFTALLIVFCAATVGYHERIRQLSTMRCMGFTRSAVSLFIVAENLTLGVFSWLGGLLTGKVLLMLLGSLLPDMFPDGTFISLSAYVLTGCIALAITLLVSIIPAVSSIRLKPLDSLRPLRFIPDPGTRWALIVLGVFLGILTPVIMYALPLSDTERKWTLLFLGWPGMAVSFILLTPFVIQAVERLGGPVVCSILRVEPRLNSRLLSVNIWRSTGTALALSVGLFLFVFIQCWGYSLLSPFMPGKDLPDAVISISPDGVPEGDVSAVSRVSGLKSGEVFPLAIAQVPLNDRMMALDNLEMSDIPTDVSTVLFFGLDPKKAFSSSGSGIGVHFVKGDPETAAEKLGSGYYCVIPDSFAAQTGLGIGDSVGVIADSSSGTELEYGIAGIVSLPGWHFITRVSGMRPEGGKTLSVIFIDRKQARRDYEILNTGFFWVNLDETASISRIEQAVAAIAAKSNEKSSVTVTTKKEVKEVLAGQADTTILAMSQLPMLLLLVSSLSMVTAIIVSVRARQWETGILRGIGITRGQVFRQVLCEAVLIFLTAAILSLVYGLIGAWSSIGMSRYALVWYVGGMEPPLIIPWLHITAGLAAGLLLCVCAALWPARSAARTEPLKLLQAGRASM